MGCSRNSFFKTNIGTDKGTGPGLALAHGHMALHQNAAVLGGWVGGWVEGAGITNSTGTPFCFLKEERA